MGAARAGLDYGELLNRGFQGNDVNQLMQGISSYLTEISGTSSNVVLNQLGKIFGLKVQDLAAIRNNGIQNVAGVGANTDAASMLNGITGLMPGVTRLRNGVANWNWQWGANLAANEDQFLNYEIAKTFIEPFGGLLGSGLSALGSLVPGIGGILGGAGNLIGNIASNASLIPFFLANINQGNLKNIGSLFSGVRNSSNGIGALDIYNALAGINGNSPISVVTSSVGTSGSMGISSGHGGGLLGSFKGSLNDLGIEEATTGDEVSIDDHIISIDTTVQSISDLLDRILSAIPSGSSSYSYSGAGGPIYGQTR